MQNVELNPSIIGKLRKEYKVVDKQKMLEFFNKIEKEKGLEKEYAYYEVSTTDNLEYKNAIFTPKYDGTQIVLKIESNKIYATTKAGAPHDNGALTLLSFVYSTNKNFSNIIEKISDKDIAIHGELYGKLYTPMKVHKNDIPIDFKIFDIQINKKYVKITDVDEMFKPLLVENSNYPKYEYLLKSEGIVIKIYDEKFHLNTKDETMEGLKAYKFKPYYLNIKDDIKKYKIKDDEKFISVIREVVDNLRKGYEINESVEEVKISHKNLESYITQNEEMIKNYIMESDTIKKLIKLK
ncbi:MAG: RNA ligase family protein [Caldisphaera sp.]